MRKSKQLGQVYTPEWVVTEILDRLQYCGRSILKKTILEPACGQGAFLIEVVRRYILAAQSEGYSHQEIISDLETYIYGIDIDLVAYTECVENLDRLCESLLSAKPLHWNIFHQDTLTWYQDYLNFFDYIVGNPPYIRIHNLPEQTRFFIKKQFEFTKGTTDLYLVFFEIAFQMLNNTGKLGYISPNSFLYNASYTAFRMYLSRTRHLNCIIDFQSHKVFNGFSTYTAISLFDFSYSYNEFEYQAFIEQEIKNINRIKFDELNASKWVLFSNENDRFLKNLFLNKEAELEQLFNIQYGFATLRDRIFISRCNKIDDVYCEFNGYKIEKAILNKIVKGSKYRGEESDIEWVIFPYQYQNGRYITYTEEEIRTQFPYAYAYLLKHKAELLSRDSDKNSPWYAFGRSQGIQTSNNEKIVLSTLMKDRVYFYYLPKDVFVYSGLFITKKEENTDWDIIDRILRSEDFSDYIRLTGKDFSGGYKSISSKQIKQYPVNLTTLQPQCAQLPLFGDKYE